METYLKWILAEKAKYTRESSKRSSIHRTILNGVLGALMTWCHDNSPEFKNNIDLFESKTIKETLKRMVHKIGDGEYIVRLYLKNKAGMGSIKTLYGLQHNIPAGCALLKLNETLPKADRLQLRDYLKDCVNAEGVISPIRVKQWLIPTLKEFFVALDESEIEGYAVSTLCTYHQEGFQVILGCCETGHRETITIKIYIEVASVALGWPKGLNLQHPLPRKQQYAQFGLELLQSIRDEFELGELALIYTSRLLPAPRKPTESDIRRMPRTQRSKLETQEADDKMKRRHWMVDTGEIEERLLTSSLGYNGLIWIGRAMVLYNVLSHMDNSHIPPLPTTLKRTLALWLMKKRAHKLQGLRDYFTALCELVLTTCSSNFCASFFQPNHNMVGEKSNVSHEDLYKFAEFVDYLKTDNVTMVKRCIGIVTQQTAYRQRSDEINNDHHDDENTYDEDENTNDENGKFMLQPSTLKQKSVVFEDEME